jgi:hypothetical protein
MPWFTLDASGPDAAHQFALGRKGQLTVWSALSSRSSAIFDLDDDGDLDIVTNEFNAEPLVLISNLSGQRDIHWLQVKLVGTATDEPAPAVESASAGEESPTATARGSNRDGLGATVRVVCSSRSHLQVHDGKSGYLSQSAMPLYFGLGDSEEVNEVEVMWPSGKRQSVPGPIAVNRLLTVREMD